MDNDDDGLAGALYRLANEAEQLSRRIRAQSVVLRHAHERFGRIIRCLLDSRRGGERA